MSEDPATWNAAAVRSRYGHVLQSAEWGSLRQAQGWEPVTLRMGEPLPVALVLWRTLPLGQKLAYVPRGPVFDHGEPAQLEAALARLAEHAHGAGAIFLKVDPEIPSDRADLIAAYEHHGFVRAAQDVQPVLATLEIDLARDEDAILAGFDKDTRWSVRTAERRGVTAQSRSDAASLQAFYELYEATGRRANFITRTSAYYLTVWRRLIDAGHASLFVATLEDRIVAAAMLFWCGDRAVYMYGASGELARKTYATYLLQWHCIRQARARGCARYDLGGVPREPRESDPMHGVYLFKKGFGGVRRELAGAYDVVPRPLLYRAWNALEPRAYAALALLRGRRAA